MKGKGSRFLQAVLTYCLQGGILVELFAWRLLFIWIRNLAQVGIWMWVSHLLEQRRSGHCVVHLGGIWKWRDRHGHKQSRAFQPPPPSSHPFRLKPSRKLWTYVEDGHTWKSIRQSDSRPSFCHCTTTRVVKTVCGAVRKAQCLGVHCAFVENSDLIISTHT